MPASAPSRPNAAIFYHPDGYDTGRPRLMGRQSAGEGLLRAFVRHGDVDRLICHAASQAIAGDFAARVKGWGADVPVHWVPLSRPEGLAEHGCLYYPGPDINAQAWRRRLRGQRGYSLVGVTHTTATHAVMDAICDWLTAPLQPWDAVICTSRAVRDTVQVLMNAQAEYLRARTGATRFVAPQLPVIPLGVDCDGFAANPEARRRWRETLGAGEDDPVVLFVGRLSLHGKAHPLAMYRALQAAAPNAPRDAKVHLVQAGWFANDAIEKTFRDSAARHCPDVVCHFLDGRDQTVRHEIWHAADVFCSLSDNIQETFGLTPIEAMAAGLPVVVSDWDGYRDTVRNGVDGFLVPTVTLPPMTGLDLADRFAAGLDSYDRYAALTSQLVAVDTEAAAAAFATLFRDAPLRRRMGEAGRTRARAEFDWREIVARYQSLWSELAAQRASAVESAPLSQAGAPLSPATSHPSRPDPFLAFRSYASRQLHPSWRVCRVAGSTEADVAEMLASPLADFVKDALPPLDVLKAVFAALSETPSPLADSLASLPPPQRTGAFRAFAWLAKMDFVRLLPPP